MMVARIGEILRKLEVVRTMPGAEKCFGAEKHRFRMCPPIAEAELLAFEQRHEVALPADYRMFLLIAGNGGAGPAYGIDPLDKWDFWFEGEAEAPGFLSSPCPLTDGEPVRLAVQAAGRRPENKGRGLVFPADSWREFLRPDWSNWGKGTIHLSDQGCTFSARLIVTGEARGRIVYLDSQLWGPPYFVRDLTFLDWYERWLAQVLRGFKSGWFGFDNPRYA